MQGYGYLNKVALRFETVFWDDRSDYVGFLQPNDAGRGLYYIAWSMSKVDSSPVCLLLHTYIHMNM